MDMHVNSSVDSCIEIKKQSIYMYPCPCGYFSDPKRACTCSHQTVTRYQKRISGPMLDRIDIYIEVPRVDFEKLSDNRQGETSDEIRARVEQARQYQRERFAGLNNGVMTNADMRVAEVRQFCELDDAGQQLIKAAMTQLQLCWFTVKWNFGSHVIVHNWRPKP